nr:hypothetical protein [Novosphingobium sp. NBM11]
MKVSPPAAIHVRRRPNRARVWSLNVPITGSSTELMIWPASISRPSVPSDKPKSLAMIAGR